MLAPRLQKLSPQAKDAWVKFHDEVENELRPGADLEDIKDVASKAADNAARLAALFHYFEHGDGCVGLSAIESARRIVAWHLHEARRFLGAMADSKEQSAALCLDAWLIERCRMSGARAIARSDAMQRGPSATRGKTELDAALVRLIELERVGVATVDSKREIHVNPALLSKKPPGD